MEELFPFESGEEGYTFECPWCKIGIFVHRDEIKCRIFRCGEVGGRQIDPHLPKEKCELIRENPSLVGCAHPFFFDGKILRKCDYI